MMEAIYLWVRMAMIETNYRSLPSVAVAMPACPATAHATAGTKDD
jgi:hypothetical protein